MKGGALGNFFVINFSDGLDLMSFVIKGGEGRRAKLGNERTYYGFFFLHSYNTNVSEQSASPARSRVKRFLFYKPPEFFEELKSGFLVDMICLAVRGGVW